MSSADRSGGAEQRPPGRTPDRPDVEQSFDIDGLYALRATLAGHARQLGAAAEQMESLIIVASELASNAIRHGGGAGHLRLWRTPGALHCQVTDSGPGITDSTVGTIPPPPTTHDGGRGMWICRNLSRELTIERGPGGRGAVVTAVIALA
jgi:anti-sigma regulatory factor (Ser/Thr protein kinase)